MEHRDRVIVEKVIQEIDTAEAMIGDTTEKDFVKGEMLKRAVAMTVINIGELVKHVSEDMRQRYPNIPWKQIAGFRDVTAHGYQSLNMNDVYNTAKIDFPRLRKELKNLLETQDNAQ